MLAFGENSDAFPEEVQLWILAELIYSRNFPSTLLQFSQVSKSGLRLARDHQLWQEALRYYFPFLVAMSTSKESNLIEQYAKNPYLLFKTLYQRCALILKNENLTFNDYVNAIQNKWGTVPLEKQSVLVALCVVSGQSAVFSNEQLARAKNHVLLFSAALGNRNTFLQVMNELIPASADVRRWAFVKACEYGHLTICAYLLSHANAVLDRQTLSDGFLNACTLGHFQIVQLLMTQPTAQALNFYFAKGLYLACMQGQTQIAAELLKNVHLRANQRALKEAIQCAATYAQVGPLEVLLQIHALNSNLILMIDFLKMAVARRNSEITSLILTHAKVSFGMTVILDVIENALNNLDDKTTQTILSNRLFTIAPYARRKILYKAAEKGMSTIVHYLLENDAKTFSAEHIGQAVRLTASNHHTLLLIALLHRHASNLSNIDKKYVLSMPCYQDHIEVKTLCGFSDIAEVALQLERMSLDSVTDVENKQHNCLMQFDSVKNVKAMSQTKQSPTLRKKSDLSILQRSH